MRRRRRFRFGARAARGLARRMVTQLPGIARLIWRLLRDPRVSRLDRALFLAVLAYIASPLDLLPDYVAVLGFIDDLYLAGLALGRLLGRAGPDLLLEHWDGDPQALGFFVGSVEELGGMLPGPIRRALDRTVEGERSVA